MADTPNVPIADDSVNVLNPENNLVSIPKAQLSEAQQLGYTIAPDETVKEFALQQKHGQGLEPVKAAAEGAARTATFGLSTKAETALGVKPEDIAGREEANPVASTAGEIGGLFVPWGEGAALAKLGEAATAGIKGAGLVSKVGSAAVRGAVETAAFQGGNEVHKMFLNDPNQTVGTAMADIGLSGLLGAGVGGGFGVVSPLWKETVGKKFGGFLGAVQKRANGEAISLAPEVESAINSSGINLAPEIRTAMSDNPELINQWQKLQESTTSPGLKAQQALRDFRKSASDNLVTSLGKSIDDIPLLSDISDHEAGQVIQNKVSETVNEKLAPLAEKFENIKNEFSQIPVTNQIKSKLQQDLAEIGQKEGYHLTPTAPQNQVLQSAIKDVNNIKFLEDLRKIRSVIGNNTYDLLNTKGLNYVGSQIKKTFNNLEESLVEAAAGAKSPQVLQEVKFARSSYRQAMDLLDTLNDRLHVGNYGGPKSFINALKDMKPEDVLRRLNPKNDAGILDVISKEFPEVSQAIKDHNINKLIAKSAIRAPEGHSINSKTFFSAIDKMSPEMKSYILPNGAFEKIKATQELLKALPERLNPSGTARTLDSLWNKMPGSATALGSMMTGHNPVTGYLFGQIAKWLGRDVPDAIRLGFLKFLGHSGPVEPGAFKAAVDFAHATMKGENLLSKGIKNLFNSSRDVGSSIIIDDKRKEKLSNKLDSLVADQSSLLDIGGDARYYLPEHGQELAATAARAVQYLSSLKPKEDKPGILDEPREPSQFEKSRYDNALTIAEAPLNILQHIKDGTITHEDIMDLRSVHPGLYDRMSQKILEQVMNVTSKSEHIPYKTRIGLSMFLGQGLDATMQPQAIAMNQPQAPQQPQSQQQGSKKATVSGSKGLKNLVTSMQTPDQARMSHKLAKA